jgi:hypothetical protein
VTENARKICRRLHAYLDLGRYAGTVYAVYPDVVYCTTPVGMVSILTNARCLMPFSLVVGSTKALTRYEIAEGQEVLLGDDKIEVPACDFSVDLSLATDYELSLDAIQTVFLPVDLDIRLRHVLRAIETNASEDDLSALVSDAKQNAFVETVLPHLKRLHEGFLEQIPSECREASALISGVGLGLTPSSDHFLCGYLSGYAALSAALGRNRERVLELTREAASGAAAHTNDLGAAFLLQSGEGLVSEDLFLLLRNLFSDASYPAIVACANKIASEKEHGGTDLLTGVYLSIVRQYGGKPLV